MFPEPTELRLMGCSTESIWTPRSKSNMLTPKTQLADMLTEESITRDEWDHLLRLINIVNLSMFSCSHFLSWKRGPQWRSRDQLVLVSNNLTSAKKDPPQDLSDPNSLGNQELDQSCVSVRGRKLLRNTNQNPTICSQERQQGQSSSTRKLGRRDESSNSARARKLSARGEDNQFGRLKSHNVQISDCRYLEKVFKNLQKKLNLAENAPPIIEALKTNVLIWGLFMTTTMKAAIHLGPNYTENLEVFRNTSSRNSRIYSTSLRSWYCIIKGRFWMWKRLNGHLFHGRDLHFRMISDHSEANRRWEGQVKEYNSTILMENYLELMENRLSSSGIFSRDLRHWKSSKESMTTCKIKTLNLRN